MTILATADLHFSAAPGNRYREAFVPWLSAELKRRKADELIILGDLTDEKDGHTAWLVNRVVGFIAEWSNIVPVVVVTGNHDYVNANIPFFEFVRHIPNVDWLREPLEDSRPELGKTLFLPHDRNYAEKWPPILKGRSFNHIFTHCTVEGSNGGHGRLAGVPLKLFEGQGRVISGDVHIPQEVKNVTYVGAPYTCKFGDDYEGRVLFIDNKGKIAGIPVGIPQKWLKVATSVKDLEKTKTPFIAGDIVRVRMQLPRADYERWNEIKRDIERWGDDNDLIVTAVPEVETTQNPKTYKRVDLGTDEELVTAHAKRAGLPRETEKRGHELLGTSKR